MHRRWRMFALIVMSAFMMGLVTVSSVGGVQANAEDVDLVLTINMGNAQGTGGNVKVKVPKGEINTMNYQDALDLSEGQFNSYKAYEVIFDTANGVITHQEGLEKSQKLEPSAALTQETFDSDVPEIMGLFKADYPSALGISVDKEAYDKLLQNPINPTLESSGEYQGSFTIPIKSNDVSDTINYVLPDGQPAADSRTVNGYQGEPDVTLDNPDSSVAGYVPDQPQTTVKFTSTGESTTTVKYSKPGSQTSGQIVRDQSTLTANPTATITVGDPVTAKTFNAQATDATGANMPVSVDLSQAKLKVPGTYSVILKAENGKQTTATLTVLPAKKSAVKQKVIYGLKTLYLYRTPTFTSKQRIAKFDQSPRTARPMFTVIGYARSQAGRLRYQVKDVNPNSKTVGQTGYITAKAGYATAAYYQKTVQRVIIIAKSGVNTYRTLSLTGKLHHDTKGAKVKVVGIVHHKLATRFVLSNGHYLTANKKLVMDTSK